MKTILFAAFVATVKADPSATDATPLHTVYNCEHVRMNVDEANDMIGNGVCNPEVNCGPYSYDLGDCWETDDEICDGDSWYSNGRENFRCSTKTGGIRLGRYGNNDATGVAQNGGWPGACDCYDFCLEKAADEGEVLTAFDMYSGKCRCWGGTCSNDEALPCFDGGDNEGEGSANDGGNGDPDAGNNWRCPAEIYFPEPKYDCDGTEITFQAPNLEQYLGDGFCDNGNVDSNIDFASATTGVSFNFNCSAYDFDAGDCELDCHQSVYWSTNFAELGNSYERVDECEHGSPIWEEEWTTACDCYDSCAAFANGAEDFLFDRDNRNMCRCWFDIAGAAFSSDPTLNNVDTTFCGLNSNCQIYQPDREISCSNIDYTLGIVNSNAPFVEGSMGSVESWDEYTMSKCVDDAMCLQNSYSHGSCFDCSRFSTDERLDSYCDAGSIEFGDISYSALDDLISDGFIAGAESEDTSTGGDNCACLNYCFSIAVENNIVADAADFYEQLNIIAEYNAAYATRGNTCICYYDCEDTLPCGTTAGDCVGDEVVYHSTVADLNVLAR
jgi:hypothetical protein